MIQRLAPEHLPLEHTSKIACGGVERILHRGLSCRIKTGVRLEFKAGHIAVRDAAWHDPLEVAEVGSDVERESMRGHALRDMHPNRRNLLFENAAASHRPHTGSLGDAL